MGTVFVFLFCSVVLLFAAWLMLTPFVRCKENSAFRWYCILLPIYILLSFFFPNPTFCSILALPVVLCLFAGWFCVLVKVKP